MMLFLRFFAWSAITAGIVVAVLGGAGYWLYRDAEGPGRAEQPNRGRVFVLRRDRTIVGMINLLFTISTAEGGFVILLEDLVVHDAFRGHGYGSQLLEYAINFAKQKKFLRITLLTDRPELRSQNFFKRHGFFESQMLPMRLLISQETAAPTTL